MEQQEEACTLVEGRDEELSRTVSAFRFLTSALGRQESEAERLRDENNVTLDLREVLRLLPEEYTPLREPSGEEEGRRIAVTVEDLFGQLARGKVVVSVADLVFCVPADIVPDEALRDRATPVELPLRLIVGTIGPAALKTRTAGRNRQYDIRGIPDPFAPAAPPVQTHLRCPKERAECARDELEPAVPGIPSPPAPAAEEPEVPVLPAPTVQEPEASVPPAPTVEKPEIPMLPAPATQEPEAPALSAPAIQAHVPEAEIDLLYASDRLGGMNLNTASVEELMTLKNVTRGIAGGIVRYRSANGPFRTVFDIHRVPRLGRKTFRNITGMVYNDAGRHRRDRLARLLGVSARDLARLPRIAEAIGHLSGFTGCVISDEDGLLLAESGTGPLAAGLSAVVPRLLRHVRENMAELTTEPVNHTSVCMRDRMLTIMTSGDIYLTAVHEANKLTKSQFVRIQRIAAELEWLLSHRGYVGPS